MIRIIKPIILKIKKTDKKKLIDLTIGFLTIPSLITLLILNLNNLKQSKVDTGDKTANNQEKTIIIQNQPTSSQSTDNNNSPKPSPIVFPSPGENCNPNPDSIQIVYPKENQTVHDNPFCVTMKIDEDDNSCPLEWAYSVNHTPLSAWSSEPICFYDLKNGKVNLKIVVKNKKSGLTKDYEVNFLYQDESTATPSATPTQP